MSFATLQEAWGVPTFDESFASRPQQPDTKTRDVQDEVLDRAEASQRSMLFVTNYLREMYSKNGVAGVMGLMDEEVVKELRMHALLSFDWLDSHTLLLVFMCLCALWLVMDLLRRRSG